MKLVVSLIAFAVIYVMVSSAAAVFNQVAQLLGQAGS